MFQIVLTASGLKPCWMSVSQKSFDVNKFSNVTWPKFQRWKLSSRVSFFISNWAHVSLVVPSPKPVSARREEGQQLGSKIQNQ